MALSSKSTQMNEVFHQVVLLTVHGPLGEATVRVDESMAAELASRRWMSLGGRVVSVGEDDDFANMLDLAEKVSSVAGAKVRADTSHDYRCCALRKLRVHTVNGAMKLVTWEESMPL
jgi:hypothetical protein